MEYEIIKKHTYVGAFYAQLFAFGCIFMIQITLMSTTSIYVAFIQHACGLFEIASYRIEHVLDNYKRETLISGKRCVTCTRIISAVDIHRRAIEFFEFMKDTFVVMYFFLLLLGIASLTVSLFRVSKMLWN
ncbi:PREDICTED: uncharacterized protein LOC105559959 [Vollenhovia emeryi]|uniref:uncharacterized protein LOC105559959 n=1 Tax=Vollenhovia emeryi TaxID=411798 RepID=UPI0005F4BAD3|nr:PREDICTED: uncharacterized protein LOC105559959 [Vollenhovia emeryi]